MTRKSKVLAALLTTALLAALLLWLGRYSVAHCNARGDWCVLLDRWTGTLHIEFVEEP